MKEKHIQQDFTYKNQKIRPFYLRYNPAMSNRQLTELFFSYFSYDNNISENNIRSVINNLFLKYYPNEAVIKSAFINKVISDGKTNVTVFEMPVNGSRIDLCKINGKSCAYEIKTDLDQLSRLNKQLNDYSKVFEEVYVVCSEKRVKEVVSCINESYGIYTYKKTNMGTYYFSKFRKYEKIGNLSPVAQLSTLTKQELLRYFQSDYADYKSNIISSLGADEINRVYKKILKDRYNNQWQFLKENMQNIQDIDYQFFFKYNIDPQLLYQ